MAQFWKASSVTVNNGSKIVTVNTGDDVANIITNSMLQISNFQYVEVKTVNTVNQTIELFFPWDKGNVSGQPAIAAPNRAAIKEAVEELRALRQTYEGLAGDVNVAASANSIPRRDGAGRVKTATPSANEDAVNKGFLGSAATKNVGTNPNDLLELGAFGLGANGDDFLSSSLDILGNLPTGFYNTYNSTTGMENLSGDTLIATRFNTDNNGRRLLLRMDGIKYKAQNSDGSWGNEIDLLHTENTGDVVTRDIITDSRDTTSGMILTTGADFNFYGLRSYGRYFPGSSGIDIDAEPSGSKGLYAANNDGTFPVDPRGAMSFFNIKTEQIYTGNARHQHAIGYFGTNASNDIPLEAFRTLDNQGTAWTPWAIKLTDRNTNLNEFGGYGAHSVIATGVGRTNSEILFYLPINSFTEPTGISVNVGFNIRGENNMDTGNENLMLANTFSGTLSSTRYCALIVGGLVNINVGQTYRLQTVNNLSKLTVNF